MVTRLSTDAWGNGKLLKDFGRIDPARMVHIAFGAPLDVLELGNRTNATIIRFIQDHLQAWIT